MTPRSSRGLTAVLLALMLTATTLAGCGTSAPARLVVLGSWVDNPDTEHDEADVFGKVLRDFTSNYGVTVDYQGTRDVPQALRSLIEEEQPPDVVIMPSAGDLASYSADGSAFQSLDSLRLGTGSSPSVLRGAKVPYAVAIKTTLKSLVWYNPQRDPEFREHPPATWDMLLKASQASTHSDAAWCIGLGATSQPGWPGTDWIEDLLLHVAGPDVYTEWATGQLPWTDDVVQTAWSTFGNLVSAPALVRGGPAGALLTSFDNAGRPLVDGTNGCRFHHQGSFMAADFTTYGPASPRPAPAHDFDYFPFPNSSGSAPSTTFEVASDFAALMTNNENGTDLLRYLTSVDDGQRVWSQYSGGSTMLAGAVATNDRGAVTARLAEDLKRASTLCLDASDMMPTKMSAAFEQAVLEFLNNQSQLKDLLKQLEPLRVQLQPNWLQIECQKLL